MSWDNPDVRVRWESRPLVAVRFASRPAPGGSSVLLILDSGTLDGGWLIGP